eukprot:403369110
MSSPSQLDLKRYLNNQSINDLTFTHRDQLLNDLEESWSKYKLQRFNNSKSVLSSPTNNAEDKEKTMNNQNYKNYFQDISTVQKELSRE